MKIADVKVTIWEWKNIPPTRYTLQVKSSGTRTAHMALVRIICDDGTEGHAFLGSALSSLGGGAEQIAASPRVEAKQIAASPRVGRSTLPQVPERGGANCRKSPGGGGANCSKSGRDKYSPA